MPGLKHIKSNRAIHKQRYQSPNFHTIKIGEAAAQSCGGKTCTGTTGCKDPDCCASNCMSCPVLFPIDCP